MMQQAVGAPVNLIVLLVLIVPIPALIANLLAREKGRNVVLWTIFGCVPAVNIWCLIFFVGAANLRLENRVDQLLRSDREGT